MILNSRRSLHHRSRVKDPLFKMSASSLRVSIYFTSIIISRLIRSNNPSSATLWVRGARLIVRLLPLMLILITASLCSKMSQQSCMAGLLGVRSDVMNLVQTKLFRRGRFRFRSSFRICLTVSRNRCPPQIRSADTHTIDLLKHCSLRRKTFLFCLTFGRLLTRFTRHVTLL